MSWLGKFIGGTVGFALGGPLGAVLGATFGHVLDSKSNYNLRNSHAEYASGGEQQKLTFFVAAFSMLAKISKADGHVSNAEISSIKNFIVQDLNLRGHSKNMAINIFNAALNSPQTFTSFANQFYNQFHAKPQILELMIDIMLRVSVADGNITQAEENLLVLASEIFKIDKTRYFRLKSKYIQNSNLKYYSILGCHKSEPDNIVKSCYRKKVLEYHPDKIAAKGLPEEFTKFAQNKFREIQEAWEHIKKERRIK